MSREVGSGPRGAVKGTYAPAASSASEAAQKSARGAPSTSGTGLEPANVRTRGMPELSGRSAHATMPQAANDPLLSVSEPGSGWSVENPPPLSVLRDQIFAVHVRRKPLSTETLPTGDPGRTFRPTLHWALGEQVQPHVNGSWDDCRYGIVTPLGTLEPQLLNVAPHDTITVGPVQLTDRAVLVVPEGTDLATLPAGIPAHVYSGKTLREAIDEVVADRNGLKISMRRGDVHLGMPAKLGDHDINDPRFFGALFEQNPALSFGTHGHSVRGEAHRFGIVDAIVRHVPAALYRPSPEELRIFAAVGRHHVSRIDAWLKTQSYSPEALEDYARSRANALEHCAGLDATAAELAQENGARRGINGAGFGIVFNSVPRSEMEGFISSHPQIFGDMDPAGLAAFRAVYAVNRWVLIGADQARAEGLPELLAETLPLVSERNILLEQIDAYLVPRCAQLPAALALLREPAAQAQLAKRGFELEPGQPQSVPDLLASHAQVKNLLAPPPDQTSDEAQLALAVAGLSGMDLSVPHAKKEDLEGMRHGDAIYAGSRVEGRRKAWDRAVDAVSTRPLNEIQPKEQLSRYTSDVLEGLRFNSTPEALFGRFGLKDAYRARFADDEAFWGHPGSLSDVYLELRAAQV